MKKALKLVLACIVGASLLTGCGPKANTGGSSGKEKTFTIATGGEPNYFDPATTGDAVTSVILQQMYWPLMAYDKDGNVVEKAAEKYTVSEDGKVYTFTLKDGNKWSDGQPVTAKDYEYGIKRSLGYGADATYARFIADNVVNAAEAKEKEKDVKDMGDVGVKALDDKTLEISLNSAVPYFLKLMPMLVFHPVREDKVQEHSNTWAFDPTVPTNGPYKLVSIKPNEEAVLVKNEHYPDADKVEVEKVIFKVMPDEQAQLQAFKTGEVDLALQVPSDVVHTYAGKEELFKIQPFVVNYYLNLNTQTPFNEALKDVRVRKALALAIDRDQILSVLNGGDLQYALYGMVPVGIPGKDGDFRTEQDKVHKYLETNVEEAKKLLAEAGYGPDKPLKLTYSYNANGMHSDVAQSLQAQWKAIGVDVELKASEIRAFFRDRADAIFDIARNAMSADYMDPFNYLELLKTTSQTKANTSDPKFDAMLDATSLELDPAKRMEMLHDVERYLVEEQVYIIPIIGYANPALLRPGITGVDHDPSGTIYVETVKLPN